MVSTPVGSNCFFHEWFQVEPYLLFRRQCQGQSLLPIPQLTPGAPWTRGLALVPAGDSIPVCVSQHSPQHTALDILPTAFMRDRLADFSAPFKMVDARRYFRPCVRKLFTSTDIEQRGRHTSKYDGSQEMWSTRWTDSNWATGGTVSDPQTPACMLRSYKFHQERWTWWST